MLDLSRLTAEQRSVVLAPDGPLVVVAGPGSGKTTVLAARVAYLVARGVPPASVLALTFTTAAARELRARLARILGEPGQRVDVRTFHGWGLRVVRQWSAELGFPAGPVAVYDPSDALGVLREAIGAVGLDLGTRPLAELYRELERHRLAGEEQRCPSGTADLVAAYEAALLRRGAVDFPGMLALPLRLLRREARALRLYQDGYQYVLADEGQDVCTLQLELLAMLAARHRNLVVVGDPWQCLYSWRGADGRFVERVRGDFPDARVLALSESFRSTRCLLDLANALGAPLGQRRLWTRNAVGRPARLVRAEDEAAEAAYVAAEIGRLAGGGLVGRVDDVAVLYRTNRQADELALALRASGIPYRVRGPGDPLGRREVRDAVAYLRLAHDPDDADALARIVNTPPRRLGRLAERLRRQPVGLADLGGLAGAPVPAGADAIAELAAMVAELHVASRRLRPDALLRHALERSGYRAWLLAQPDGCARAAHLARLEAAAARAEGDLGDWLAELRLGEADTADGPGVLLSTIHLAKGGEWAAVFLVGAEEGLLPHARALVEGSRAALEEELRLAFVAVTRARDRLYVSHCRARRLGEGSVERRPSRFLRAVPTSLLAPAGRAA